MTTPTQTRRNEADLPAHEHSVSRRTLLRSVGLGTSVLAVVGTGAVSYRAFDNGILDAGSGDAYDAWSHWRDDPTPLGAVAAAILAANPHNTQPWIFEVDDAGVDLFRDPSRLMPALDPLGREAALGLGCALENLVLGAEARGYRTTVTLVPDPSAADHVAHVSLEPGTRKSSALHDAIGDRHSNRGPYSSRPVPESLRATLTALGDDLPGVSLRWLASETERAAFAELTIEATEAIIDDEEQSKESFSWFRSSRDDIDRHKDGLTLDGLGLNSLTLSAAKLLPASSRAAGDRFWLDQTRDVHTATARTYGVITAVDSTDERTRLHAGRLLQRIHLAATAHDLALQHMNQVIERIEREASKGLPATLEPRMDALLGPTGTHPLASFRLGYPGRAAARSPRRPVEEVTR